MIVAIDGPSGAGKSTIAKQVAEELDFSCLDTGAMYRAIAYDALRNGIDLEDEDALTHLACTKEISFAAPSGTDEASSKLTAVLLDGEDISAYIRTAEIDKAVSPVSQQARVREALVAQQQRIGLTGNYVVEGRDIGSVVFPDAAVKIFLTADADERARRRVKQNMQRGVGNCDFEAVLADLARRDYADTHRESSPLVQAEDAILIDSTDLTEAEVVARIAALVREKQQ